ncbi:hypothetical protein PoB_001184400 [Plakobranchus ocellatus]|uniref:Uncharacterized protein n=1 Tax=Plakobranchus ocellatus TaxID=259542 RepID=A0AAV3YTG7_9GAST|nr:hypothetical protein PoB_001184400 [Plakobranchus ocellatus]
MLAEALAPAIRTQACFSFSGGDVPETANMMKSVNKITRVNCNNVHNKVIPGFKALRQAGAPMAGLELSPDPEPDSQATVPPTPPM